MNRPLLASLAAAALGPHADAQCTVLGVSPQDINAGDAYGISVSASGNRALVSAYDALFESGAVYDLRWQDGTFVIQDKLTPSDADPFDQFGTHVAVQGDLAVIGAPIDEVNGFASGSAYVFQFDADEDEWVERSKLLAFDGTPYDVYGLATATDGVYAFVGCPEDDDIGPGAGSVYVYAPDADRWTYLQKLLASDAEPASRFGEAISAESGTLVVGASLAQSAGLGTGAAYVFDLVGAEWVQQAELFPPDAKPLASFGFAVDIAGDLIAVGAPEDDSASDDAGAVHVYRRDGDAWVHEAIIVPDDVEPFDGFGSTVSIDHDTLIVGSRAVDAKTGQVGAAYLYRRSPGANWSFVQRLTPPADRTAAYFGWAVSHDDAHAIIGAPYAAGAGPDTGSSYASDLSQCVCEADLDADGDLTILDFVVLQLAFTQGDPGADVNADGALNILDFVTYQLLFAAGCD